jgi:hypothetical protein
MNTKRINENTLNQLNERDLNRIINTIDILTSKTKRTRFKDEEFRYKNFKSFLRKFGLLFKVEDTKINLYTNFNKKYAGNITFLKQYGEVKVKLNLFNINFIDDLDQFMAVSSDDKLGNYINQVEEYVLANQLHEELRSICESILKNNGFI